MAPTNNRSDAHFYHERQRLALCGKHAVNNLLQTQRFEKSDFDHVCTQLSPNFFFNPHRSCLGIGDYDVNVVSLLLQQEGYSVQWHDQRNEITPETLLLRSVDHDEDDNSKLLVGILWNVPSTSIWGRLWGGRHWIALLYDKNRNNGNEQQQQWVNLDSGLSTPQVVGTNEQCAQLLNANRNESHVLLVSRAR